MLVPYTFRKDIATVDANVIRSFGVGIIQRVTLGHLVDARQSSVLPRFPVRRGDRRPFPGEIRAPDRAAVRALHPVPAVHPAIRHLPRPRHVRPPRK